MQEAVRQLVVVMATGAVIAGAVAAVVCIGDLVLKEIDRRQRRQARRVRKAASTAGTAEAKRLAG